MARIIEHDGGGKVLSFRESADTSEFLGRLNVLINPDLRLVASVPQKYWKVEGGLVVEMRQTEKDAHDAEIAAAEQERIDFLGGIKTKLIGLGFTEREVDYLMGRIL